MSGISSNSYLPSRIKGFGKQHSREYSREYSKELTAARPRLGWLSCVLFAVSMLCVFDTSADTRNLLFFVSKPATDYLEVLNTVKQGLEEQFPGQYHTTVEFISRDKSSAGEIQGEIESADLIVTIGTAAADTAYQYQPNVPILSALITESSFIALAGKYYGSVEQALARRVSSISIDQPTSRSARLAKLLLPAAKKVGVMLGPSAVGRQTELTDIISAAGMQPQFVRIGARDNPIHKIEPVLRDSDVFIPVPDSRLINLATAKWILHLSYRHKVPVIAFSRTYLKAGALAAIYSSPENVAMQTLELIAETAESPDRAGRAYTPKYYSIHFNYSVAATLNVPLRKEKFYRQRLGGE